MAFSLNATITGLISIVTKIPDAQSLSVSGTLTLPSIDQGSANQSQVVVTVSRTPNGGSPSVIYTGAASSKGFSLIAQCAALDTITVALSSSLADDAAIGAVKATISIG